MQTHAVDVVKAFFKAVETRDIDKVRTHLSSDFVMSGVGVSALNKYQFLELIENLRRRVPKLAFDIQRIQEDNQLPQSDRVDVDVRVNGIETTDGGRSSKSAAPQQGQEDVAAPSPQERVSFTVMGDVIASLVVAGERGNLGSLLSQLEQAVRDGGEVGDAQRRRDHGDVPDDKLYNRQSNLYDPEGKTYTPTSNELDFAPQVDTYKLSRERQDEANPLVFHTQQEQDELMRRDPDTHLEE